MIDDVFHQIRRDFGDGYTLDLLIRVVGTIHRVDDGWPRRFVESVASSHLSVEDSFLD